MSTRSNSFIATERISSLPHVQTQPRKLNVKEVGPGLHEKAEGISRLPIYWLHWEKDPVRLFGRWPIPATGGSSGKYVRLSPPLVRKMLEVNFTQDFLKFDQVPPNLAIFLSTNLSNTHIRLVMAAQNGGQWTELCHWETTWTESGISRMDICDV